MSYKDRDGNEKIVGYGNSKLILRESGFFHVLGHLFHLFKLILLKKIILIIFQLTIFIQMLYGYIGFFMDI